MNKGRIAQFKKRIEDLTKSMQLFCIQPGLALFNEICGCDGVKRAEGDDFVAWRRACLFKYAADWGIKPDPDNPNLTAEHTTQAFMLYDALLCKKAIEQPSQSAFLKILHMFFATGELKYIDLFYQGMGHEGLPIQTRRYLAGVYTATKEMYIDAYPGDEKIKSLGLTPSTINFSYFDDVKKRALSEKDRIKKLKDLLGDAVI